MGKITKDRTAGKSLATARTMTRKERRKEQRATKKRSKELFFKKKYGKVSGIEEGDDNMSAGNTAAKVRQEKERGRGEEHQTTGKTIGHEEKKVEGRQTPEKLL